MNVLRCLCLVAALACASLASLAADVPLPAGVTKVTSVEGITEYNLANGLRVLFAPDASKPTTTVNTTYLVGSRHENYGETGMAHLLEHLLFKGTPTYPSAWLEFTRRGLRANGTTSQDRTNYFASFVANDDNLEWYLRWSADAMTNSFIAKKDLDSEMTVVRNELESGENDPFRSLLQRTMSAAYLWHNYGKSTIGARADVENVSIERLQAFYRNYYQPDNAVLILAGKFDEAKTLALIARTFGAIPRPARKLLATYTVETPQEGERSVTLRRVGDTQLVMAMYHIPAGPSPDFGAMELLTSILAETPAGRLHRALVESKQAAGVFGFAWTLKEPGVLILGARLPNDASLETAKSTLLATLEDMERQPITAAEVERARIKYLKEFDLTASDPEKIGVALSGAIALGDWRLFFIERDHVRKATVADVQRLATAYLLPANRTLGTFMPTAQPRRAPAPQLVDVAPLVKDYRGDPAVAPGEAFDPSPENIEARTQRLRLANGMKVALLPKRTRGATVNARLVLHLGDEQGLFGTTPAGAMSAAMLNRGAANLSRQDIQDAFDRLKARVAFQGDSERASVSIETTRVNLAEVLKLVATVLRKPSFPANELDQLRNERITAIESQRKEPNAIANLAAARHDNPYPKGHLRYVQNFDESIAAIRSVPVDRIRSFHADFYGADSAELAVVGDLEAPAVQALLAEHFGAWRAARRYQRVPNPVYAMTPVRTLIATPDKANAFFRALQRFPLRDDDPDYAAMLVANHIVGGGTNSMLWRRIREKDGTSYGVGSAFIASSHEPSAVWRAAAIYAPQNLARLEQAFREELARAHRDGFTPDEVKDSKSGLLLERRLERAQDDALAGTLAGMLELDRTMAFSAKVDREIEALTPERVTAAFRRHVNPAALVMFYAGDFAKAGAK